MSKLTRDEIAAESLARARNGQSMANYAAIFEGFAAKGIAASEIEPRVNVLTYNAWRAIGRQVRRGEHGVKVCTFIEVDGKESPDGTESSGYRMPKTTTVFHVTQTDAVDPNAPRPSYSPRSHGRRGGQSTYHAGASAENYDRTSMYADPAEHAADRWNETH